MITLFKETLKEILKCDNEIDEIKDRKGAASKIEALYNKRYNLVFEALYQALRCGFNVGIQFDESEKAGLEWPVVCIELPTGQISWHCPQHEVEYDGHNTDEKYVRINKFIRDWQK